MTREGARQAIVEPARLEDKALGSAPFAYEEDEAGDVVAAILDFLARQRRVEAIVPIDEVEPVQLQLLCRHFETEIAGRERTAGGEEVVITLADLGGEQEAERDRTLRGVLERFYERTLASLKTGWQRMAVRPSESLPRIIGWAACLPVSSMARWRSQLPES